MFRVINFGLVLGLLFSTVACIDCGSVKKEQPKKEEVKKELPKKKEAEKPKKVEAPKK